MYIKYQNLRRDESGIIISGSASIIETKYIPNKVGDRTKSHSQQNTLGRLGKVIWRNETNPHQGIFNSPIHGLVAYDAEKDEFSEVDPNDSRLHGTKFQRKMDLVHTNFGNTYLFFSEMEKSGYMEVLRSSFSDSILYQKLLIHLAHDCLKNGSFIKCGEFLKNSFLSYLLTDIPPGILDCDSSYYHALSDDDLKVTFFKELIKKMRSSYPDFGRCCYVDSTPLPGEAKNNPFNALSRHGTKGTEIQSRLVLVLDIQTHIPIWFQIIPANVLDKSTILSISNDVKASLNIDIDMFDLDAGYAREELFELFNRNNSTYLDQDGVERDHTVLVRMPAIKGYPRDDLYIRSKPHFFDPDYMFSYEHHTFFGERFEVDIFNHPMYAFVFIDKTQAESLLRGWREDHEDEWQVLSHSAKEWYMVKDGFFVLLGNKDQSPINALIEYRGRAHIEGFFRDGKAYLRILPISKWNCETVKGKIFHDIIEMIFYRGYRKRVSPVGASMSTIIVRMDSWGCFKINENMIETWTPKKQVRETLEALGYTALGHYKLDDIRNEILKGIPMEQKTAKRKDKRKMFMPKMSISPEEKIESESNQSGRASRKNKKHKEFVYFDLL